MNSDEEISIKYSALMKFYGKAKYETLRKFNLNYKLLLADYIYNKLSFWITQPLEDE